MTSDQREITELLHRIQDGDEQAIGDLMPVVYHELHRLAAAMMRRERSNHTLQATAVVHDAFLRIVHGEQVDIDSRAHFFAVAARCMRHVLVDHARRRVADKRGGPAPPIALDEEIGVPPQQSADALAVHQALEQLEQLDPRQARIVQMHYFAGNTVAEIALALHIGQRTVKRELQTARLFLKHRLRPQGPMPPSAN